MGTVYTSSTSGAIARVALAVAIGCGLPAAAAAERAVPPEPEPVWRVAPGDTLMAGDRVGRAVKSLAVRGVGRATMYVDDETHDFRRVSLVIETANGAIWSPAITLALDCGMGKCDEPGEPRARLRAITVGGKPAAALDLTVSHTFVHYDDDGRAASTRHWKRRVFIVCNTNTCAAADLGSPYLACTATLSATGVLRHRCETTETLAF